MSLAQRPPYFIANLERLTLSSYMAIKKWLHSSEKWKDRQGHTGRRAEDGWAFLKIYNRVRSSRQITNQCFVLLRQGWYRFVDTQVMEDQAWCEWDPNTISIRGSHDSWRLFELHYTRGRFSNYYTSFNYQLTVLIPGQNRQAICLRFLM